MGPPLIVLDTMVVVSAVIGSRDGPSAAVLDLIAAGDVRLAISDDQLSELVRVFGYPNIEARGGRPVRAFEVALDLGYMGHMYHPRRLDWPSLQDFGDRWIFDLAYHADADYIVSGDHDVGRAAEALGFRCELPEGLLAVLRERCHEQ